MCKQLPRDDDTKLKKIRWYDWLLYRLFRWRWNPILMTHPKMLDFFIISMQEYRRQYKSEEVFK